MRLEATLPDSRGDALIKLADELGLSRSQVVDEAVALFLKAVLEVRKGRRLVTVDAVTPGPTCEMATPTLATLEWTANAEQLRLSATAVAKLHSLSESPRKPGARLRSAARRLAQVRRQCES
jgi:hypothetical protein